MRRTVNYKNLVPAQSFIGQYMDHMSALETPDAYDFWCAVWVQSIVVGRRIRVARPRIPVYLNWYIMLISESGITRKSTAVRFATDLLRKFLGDNSDVDLYEDKTTPEQFEIAINKLSRERGHAHIALAISELVRFLGKERYNMSLPGLLTDLYDCPEFRRGPGTVARGEIIMREVFLSFLSASTATWLVRAINPDVIEGGFTSRVIYIHREKPKRSIAWPTDTPLNQQKNLLNELEHTRELTNQFAEIGLNPPALKHFKKWYKHRKHHFDPFNASWDAREDEHVLRLAATLAINDRSWLVNTLHIKRAITILTEVRTHGSQLFDGVVMQDDFVVGIEKLRSTLLEQGMDPISQTALFMAVRNYLDGTQFNAILTVMHELQMVQKFKQARDGVGRRKTLWRGTDALVGKGAMQTVMKDLGVAVDD